MMSNPFKGDMADDDLFKMMVDNNLEKADMKYGTDPEYNRVRTGVVNYYQKGEFRNAWLDLANYLGSKLNEGKNLVDQQVFNILVEQVNPVVTKADILNLLKK